MTFSDADWSLTNYGNTNATATQNVNGFSGTCRRVVHPLRGLAAIRAFHKYLPASATLDRANGEVVSIDFSIKAKFINGVGIVGHSIGRHQRRRHRRRFRLRHLRPRVRRAQSPLTLGRIASLTIETGRARCVAPGLFLRPRQAPLAAPRLSHHPVSSSDHTEFHPRSHDLKLFLLMLALCFELADFSAAAQSPRVEVVVSDHLSSTPLDGRVLLMISTSGDQEPRFQISEGVKSQQIFGVDAEGFAPGKPVVIDSAALGYPVESLASIPAGDYFVQALLHKYETFKRSDGHIVKLPMDRGEGQHWNRAPGNLYSTPVKVHFDATSAAPIRVTLDKEIPAIEPPKDTKYIKHIRIQSKLLTDFWGRPMHLGAVVLLPIGFDEHPEARYPLVLNHGHFESTFGEFREAPPDPNLKPEYSERFKMDGYNIIQQQLAHQFFLDWTGPDFPRFVIIKVQHANPFYDDSYAVNSANLGPYGDAIMTELLPVIEKQFRCIGEGWSRFTYGGSTGGWEALAVQMFYPDQFNGCFAACPDPIDFRAYGTVDIYKDQNAYFTQGPWARVPRPATRDGRGVATSSLEETNRRELVLGTHSRSGDQWDIWEAVYSPVGPDGYPARIWDKRTGVVDPKVAAFWKENYDLRHILERDWQLLAPKLKGKIHIYAGTMDNYFLNNAVVLMEGFLNKTNPPYAGLVDYGCNAEHCWNGDHFNPNAVSRLRYHQMYVDKMLKRMEETAPKGSDLTSWRYH